MRKKIFVRAPCLSQSGYGEQSRFALRALKSREDLFDIYIQPINWGQTGWIWQDDPFRRWMDEKIIKTQIMLTEKTLKPDISLQVTIPNEFQKICPVNIGYTAGIEATHVSPAWLQKANEQVDKVLVVSEHSRETFVRTIATAQHNQTGQTMEYRLQTPIDVVWECTPIAEVEEIPNFDLEFDSNFLMVSQMGIRKNFSNSIKWFIEEFIDKEVGLVLKTNVKNNSVIDKNRCEKHLGELLSQYPDRKCKVYLMHGDMTSAEINSLYQHPKIKYMVSFFLIQLNQQIPILELSILTT